MSPVGTMLPGALEYLLHILRIENAPEVTDEQPRITVEVPPLVPDLGR